MQGFKGRCEQEAGWQSEEELDRMSFGLPETSVLLHH